MKKLKSVGLFLIIIIFGILFIPKIFNRIIDNKVVDNNRSTSASPLQFIFLNGDAKKSLILRFLTKTV